MKFIATATRQYNDQPQIKPVTFEAANISEAYHWVINHLDCSYKWDFDAVDMCKEPGHLSNFSIQHIS